MYCGDLRNQQKHATLITLLPFWKGDRLPVVLVDDMEPWEFRFSSDTGLELGLEAFGRLQQEHGSGVWDGVPLEFRDDRPPPAE